MKKFSILLILALLAAFIVAPGASAQGITWTSGFQVQNLGSTTANIVVKYYNQDGTQPIADVSTTIPAGSSKNFFPIDPPDGFNGSVVVEGDQPIVAMANTLGNFPQYQASTESFSAGATKVGLPLIMRANSGYYTWFNVQNAGSADASVSAAAANPRNVRTREDDISTAAGASRRDLRLALSERQTQSGLDVMERCHRTGIPGLDDGVLVERSKLHEGQNGGRAGDGLA